jgi:hypothetical protein
MVSNIGPMNEKRQCFIGFQEGILGGVFKQREISGFHGCITVGTSMTVTPGLSIAKTPHKGILRRFDRTSSTFRTAIPGYRGGR